MLKIMWEYSYFSRDFWFQTLISLDSVRDSLVPYPSIFN